MNSWKFKSQYPTAVNVFDNDMYVDGLVTGTSGTIEAKQMVDQLININSYGQFQPRKWCSNIPEVISHLTNELFNKEDITLILDQNKALSYSWNSREDKTWNRKIKGNDLLPRDLAERWLPWTPELRLLKISVPRCVMKPNLNYKDAEFCVFGDASSKGWSAVLYVGFILNDESIKLGFFTSLTRIRQHKEITIRRMELEAAVYLLALLNICTQCIQLKL
ncbi:unnamed protein product [Lepeophtheirus salmonis]|uniref:(salmon louse) hypothetical protein n=1 Tax=Lepeophtheirus salmonis TaxID=72036 RepID=A0A7R8CRH9_LEPSM|nr:unnamed protein product [Lepeophtheirus salmonis]CAF2905887.1 unnamed protein product [Lepeophtheirus salmonis]